MSLTASRDTRPDGEGELGGHVHATHEVLEYERVQLKLPELARRKNIGRLCHEIAIMHNTPSGRHHHIIRAVT